VQAWSLLGFVLAMAWDLYKERRERGRRDDAVLFAPKAEIDSIAATVKNNQALVRRELGILPGQHLINPLDPIEGGFWDVVKLNPPQVFLADEATLSQVRDVARRTDQVNEMLRSRETFRVGNQGCRNTPTSLRPTTR
jgi:hypothetical protein